VLKFAAIMSARSMAAFVGFWLFLSAFLWPHGRVQLTNAWVVGIVAVTVALAGLDGHPRARFINVALGLWLVVSTFFLPGTTHATAVNHVLVGALLVTLGSVRRIGHSPTTQSP
jgi:hypothetical protein